MNQFGDLYSQYYDLLYQNKDYKGEVEYINKLIKKYSSHALSILDLGCGTGRHAELFCDKGYYVHGIDLSPEMLKIAETRSKGREHCLSFSLSNITEVKLNKKFDVVTSLFHVMCYQNTNEDLVKSIDAAKNHLNEDGIFIFDFWYGPAVLSDPPVTSIKRLENEIIKITRIAESLIHPRKNVVEVNYDIFAIEKDQPNRIVQKQEKHDIRYFFDLELEFILKSMGFTIVDKFKWMSEEKPSLKSWNAVWVTKK